MQSSPRNAETVCILRKQVKKSKWTPKTYITKTFSHKPSPRYEN